MKFKDAKVVYEFAESDYDLFEVEAIFLNEEAAIEFGGHNLANHKKTRGRNRTKLLEFNVRLAHETYEESQTRYDMEFWNDFDKYYRGMLAKIAERSVEIYNQERKS